MSWMARAWALHHAREEGGHGQAKVGKQLGSVHAPVQPALVHFLSHPQRAAQGPVLLRPVAAGLRLSLIHI